MHSSQLVEVDRKFYTKYRQFLNTFFFCVCEIMIFIYLWLILSYQFFKSSICDFVILPFFGRSVLFVRPDYRPQGIWPGKG